MAWAELRSAMKSVSLPSSGMNEFLPLLLRWKGAGHGHSVFAEFIVSFFGLLDESVFHHLRQDVEAEHFQGMAGEVQPLEELFGDDALCGPVAEIGDQLVGEFAFLHAFSRFLFFLFSHNRIC